MSSKRSSLARGRGGFHRKNSTRTGPGKEKASNKTSIKVQKEKLEKELKELKAATEEQIQNAVNEAKAKDHEIIRKEIDAIEVKSEAKRQDERDLFYTETERILSEEMHRMQKEVRERVSNDIDRKIEYMTQQNVDLNSECQDLEKKVGVGKTEIQRMNKWKATQMKEAEKAKQMVENMKKQIERGKRAHADMMQFQTVCKYQAIHFFLLDYKIRSGLANLIEEQSQFCQSLAEDRVLQSINNSLLENELKDFLDTASSVGKGVKAYRINARSAHRRGVDKPTALQMLEALGMAHSFLKHFTDGVGNAVDGMEKSAQMYFQDNNKWTSKAVYTEEKLKKLTESRDKMMEELNSLKQDHKMKELKQNVHQRNLDRILKAKGVRVDPSEMKEDDFGCYKDLLVKYVKEGNRRHHPAPQDEGGASKAHVPHRKQKKKDNLILEVFGSHNKHRAKRKPSQPKPDEPEDVIKNHFRRQTPEPPRTQFPLRGNLGTKGMKKANNTILALGGGEVDPYAIEMRK